jgi:5-methylcytosine-specific restriction endonuclease McrA
MAPESRKIECLCLQCGGKFLVVPSHIAVGGGKYCSRKCYHEAKKETLVISTCQQCGKSFEAHPIDIKNGARFCSRECANSAQTLSIETRCLKCGKVFHLKPYQVKSGVKYCSRECYCTAKPWIEVPCSMCGNLFSVSKSRYEKYGAKYCSNECRHKDRVKLITCLCPTCGKEFKKPPSLLTGKSNYCSRLCAGKAHSQRTSGKNNYFYRGGTTGYRGLNWKEQRQLAYTRDGGMCQNCGLTEAQSLKKFRGRCQVHHIRPYRDYKYEYGKGCYLMANDLKNLITLCRSCHKKAEWGKLLLQPKLL